MYRIEALLKQIKPLGGEWKGRAKTHLDRLTKPPGSLGRLEDIASWYIQVTGKCPPLTPKKLLYVFAADHGVVEEGVSAYPKAVTAQMVRNFLCGGAAVNVLARHAGVRVRVVDMGVDADFEALPDLIRHKLAQGTQNMTLGPAMTREMAISAILVGVGLAKEAARNDVTLLGTGEMGIGNTTASSAITAILSHSAIEAVTGRGTGIGDEALSLKQRVIHLAISKNNPKDKDPIDVLQKVGGFEIGAMTGLMIGAAIHRIPLVLDGFIATAAALIAVALNPEIKSYLLAAHQSAEPGHRIALEHLGLSPLFDFDLRLGEGTGATLGMGMVDAAIKIANEMATFDEAGVSKKTER